jgi:hypothetical protein
MRVIALLFNSTALIFLVYLFISEWPHSDYELGWSFGLFVFLCVNIFALSKPFVDENSWIGLFLRRKRLEEIKRIEKLDKEVEL